MYWINEMLEVLLYTKNNARIIFVISNVFLEKKLSGNKQQQKKGFLSIFRVLGLRLRLRARGLNVDVTDGCGSFTSNLQLHINQTHTHRG